MRQKKEKEQGQEKSKKHHLSIGNTVNAVTLKVYLEQFVKADQTLTEMEESVAEMQKLINNIIENFDKNEIIIIAIIHSRDVVADAEDPFLPSVEKPHAHFIIKFKNYKKRIHISTLLNMLDIHFRNPEDATLFKKGCESLGGSYRENAIYLLHNSAQAIKDGKAEYKPEEFIANLSKTEIESLINGKLNLDKSPKPTLEFLTALDQTAYNLGLNSKPMDRVSAWQNFYDNLPFSIRSSAKIKYIEESYQRGIRHQPQKTKNGN
ncbi:hypothetical protein SAMN02745136_04771 [Anaerocolumna jejuensis DSM 15929]|uniref:Uncharacterized protein n=1 Tax=Anaerocolumna jejuensis DSM 15929 TaxID=1121322 RepID=A0A1M7A6Q2_9FIRM|nr:Rep family protein [Anaerocolumna jejuensis]SHL38414.1 hypothetical protein SAMN02745136_04771 [Anaerocolumna jejuensis DSM 15929]